MLMRRFLLTVSAALMTSTFATAETPTLVPEKSTITFVGTKPDGKHEGGFKKFVAAANLNHENPTAGSLAIEIDASSLWSDDERLTNHLKNPDFFDVRKCPKILFESTKLELGEPGKATMVGEMTMLEKTVPVEVPVTYEMTDEMLTLTADFTIDRTKWGMTYGQGKIDNTVPIKAKLVFER